MAAKKVLPRVFPEHLLVTDERALDGIGDDSFFLTHASLESIEQHGTQVAVYRLEEVRTLNIDRSLEP